MIGTIATGIFYYVLPNITDFSTTAGKLYYLNASNKWIEATNSSSFSFQLAIGGSHIFVLGSSANVIFQGYSAASGTTLVYTNLGYQK